MATFNVHLEAVTGVSVEVEADDPEAAIDIAFEQGSFQGLCHQCAGYRGKWGKEEGEYEPKAVTNAEGDEVWTNGPQDGAS